MITKTSGNWFCILEAVLILMLLGGLRSLEEARSLEYKKDVAIRIYKLIYTAKQGKRVTGEGAATHLPEKQMGLLLA